MQTIYKYDLKVTDRQEIEIPVGAKILCVQTQSNSPRIWVACDSSKPKETVTFITHGTGHPMAEELMQYIGTYQIFAGSQVYHLFKKL